MTPRYAVRCSYKRQSGDRNPFVIPWVRTTAGREEITLGVSIRCWVYVYEYGSRGRRSKSDTIRYEKKTKKAGRHITVGRRTAVAHNIRDQAYL